MDADTSAAHNKNLTFEFLGLLGRLSAFRVAAEDLFGAYILSIGGTSCLPLKKVAQLATGCQ